MKWDLKWNHWSQYESKSNPIGSEELLACNVHGADDSLILKIPNVLQTAPLDVVTELQRLQAPRGGSLDKLVSSLLNSELIWGFKSHCAPKVNSGRFRETEQAIFGTLLQSWRLGTNTGSIKPEDLLAIKGDNRRKAHTRESFLSAGC